MFLYSSFRFEMAVVNVTVVMGAKAFHDIRLERKQVQKIIIHKDYRPPQLDSDLALLLLATPVQFTHFKMPVCLQGKEAPWDRCWMAEWVSAYGYGMSSSQNMQLQKLRVTQLSWKACSAKVEQLSQKMLCAWQELDTNGNCRGDSGAPMVCANWGTRRLFQVGIFSWGLTSGSRGRPGMFVSVAQFVPWIQEETQKEGRAYILSGSPKSSLTCSPQGLLALGLGSQVLLAAMLS
nr:serine protease 55-like [Cavia porcellus]